MRKTKNPRDKISGRTEQVPRVEEALAVCHLGKERIEQDSALTWGDSRKPKGLLPMGAPSGKEKKSRV